jgi:undecaprenyl diphosphate synthase
MDQPSHIAIIMDGNGRWAELRQRPRTYGHIRGARTAKNIITAAVARGIKQLTLFTFSTENWHRPQAEVDFLMRLLARQIVREQNTLMKNNVRFSTIGDLSRLPTAVRQIVLETIEMTCTNTGMNLVFALNYGGRQEILSAARQIAFQVATGQTQMSDVTEDFFSKTLESSFLPDPDLLIRTSGEQRLSNFLLWSSAYSEILFIEKHWPDFTSQDLDNAIKEYQKRERRFGRVTKHRETELPTT